MIDFTLLLVIVALLVFIAWNELRHEKHIKELEKQNKTVVTVPASSYQVGAAKGRPVQSPIMRTDDNEIMLNEIPFMEIPKDFKIEHEGSPETPTKAVARKGGE